MYLSPSCNEYSNMLDAFHNIDERERLFVMVEYHSDQFVRFEEQHIYKFMLNKPSKKTK